MQRSLEQEVGLEEGRLTAISLRSKCRKLESESLFAEVFEKYEEEIRQLQVTVRIIHTLWCVLHRCSHMHLADHASYWVSSVTSSRGFFL